MLPFLYPLEWGAASVFSSFERVKVGISYVSLFIHSLYGGFESSYQEKVEEGVWQPIHVSRGGPLISHLLFADDVLLFRRPQLRSGADGM